MRDEANVRFRRWCRTATNGSELSFLDFGGPVSEGQCNKMLRQSRIRIVAPLCGTSGAYPDSFQVSGVR